MLDRAQSLLNFWFGVPGSPEADGPREVWFKVDPPFDEMLRERFLADHESAALGERDNWLDAPGTSLALTLLLDQLPRNLFRGLARAFASDAKARAVAQRAIALGFDRTVTPIRRWFFYLPFEHSEAITDQELSLRLYASLPASQDRDMCLDIAGRHHAIIARFGRFPHRNRILGRVSTPEEEEFLRQPGSSF